jgi:hypothetical protein
MKLFQCQRCGQLVYFENTRCESCGLALGYLSHEEILSALEPRGGDLWEPLTQRGRAYRYRANAFYGVCNWMTPAEESQQLCLACRLNRTIPNLGDSVQRQRWWLLEGVKHRLVYSILRLGLPLAPQGDDPATGLAFDFLADADYGFRETPKLMTGHLNGVITIDTAEADTAERERRRTDVGESYRTLPGHFRHEIGHYYWGRFFPEGPRLEEFRKRFGDERRNYAQALEAHYGSGPPPDWRERFVSAYASAHPWEDWAETWAHYLHIVDTMETASAFGIAPRRRAGSGPNLADDPNFDPYQETDFSRLIEAWLPLTYAVNSLNRSMGQPDLYPFVLSLGALEKLRFVHDVIRRS